MFKNIGSIVCAFFLVFGLIFSKKTCADSLVFEDLTSYSLTEEDFSGLKDALFFASSVEVGELAALATGAVVGMNEIFMQKFNSSTRQERTKCVFFAFTNPETRSCIEAIVKDGAKLDLFRYILIYLERDMETEFFDFDLFRLNAASLAKILSLDESIVIEYLEQKNIRSFFYI